MARSHLKLSIWILKSMTNKRKYLFFFGLLIAGIIIYFLIPSTNETKKSLNNIGKNSSDDSQINSADIEHVDNKLNKIPKDKQRNLFVNKISPDWKKKLETSLTLQMGSELKDLNVQPLKSLILERDGHALHVQAVLIRVKNSRNVESSFNAMVDSQTGKVLETWNQPVFEPDFNFHKN